MPCHHVICIYLLYQVCPLFSMAALSPAPIEFETDVQHPQIRAHASARVGWEETHDVVGQTAIGWKHKRIFAITNPIACNGNIQRFLNEKSNTAGFSLGNFNTLPRLVSGSLEISAAKLASGLSWLATSLKANLIKKLDSSTYSVALHVVIVFWLP